MKIYNEMPLDKYIELYTSEQIASDFKSFEDRILKQTPVSLNMDEDKVIMLRWCIIDDDEEDYAGLAICYDVIKNGSVIKQGFYHDDSFYSYAEKEGIERWIDIVVNDYNSSL